MVRPLLSAVVVVAVEVVEAVMEVWLPDSRSCRSRKRIVFIALDGKGVFWDSSRLRR